jgi:hypothetical protein
LEDVPTDHPRPTATPEHLTPVALHGGIEALKASPVARSAIIGLVATPGVGERCDWCVKRFVSTTLQQLMTVRQTAPQARLVGCPSPLDMSVVVARAVVGQAQKRERLRPFPWPPRLALGNTTARHEARFIRREGSSEFRQPLDHDLLEALRVGAVLETDHDIVHVAHQVRLPVQAWFHATVTPPIQHVVEREVAQDHTAAPPVGAPFLARFHPAVFQPPGFQPPSNQAEEAGVSDAVVHQATAPSLV